jgi:hypothetical protein
LFSRRPFASIRGQPQIKRIRVNTPHYMNENCPQEVAGCWLSAPAVGKIQIDAAMIADRYNGGGDSEYARKFDYVWGMIAP